MVTLSFITEYLRGCLRKLIYRLLSEDDEPNNLEDENDE